MLSSLFAAVLLSSLTTAIAASHLAQPVVQHVDRRAEYQGGWALTLNGEPGCPADASVSCPAGNNPTCCPKGQTCFSDFPQGSYYCCPTNTDCRVAVTNFVLCANQTWNMFIASDGGVFCCEPGTTAITGVNGYGLCEPPSFPVPSSLLATSTTQYGAAAAPSAATTSAGASGGSSSGTIANTIANTTPSGTAKTALTTAALTTPSASAQVATTGTQVATTISSAPAVSATTPATSAPAPSSTGKTSGGNIVRGGLLDGGVLAILVAVAGLFLRL